MIILPKIKPLFAHTDHHLHHSKNLTNQEKAKVKEHHNQNHQNHHNHQMKHQEKKNQQENPTVTQPVLTENNVFLTSNLVAPLTLGEYLFLSMITSPFVLYLIKRKI